MKIAFSVNAVATEVPRYTTTLLARAAALRGHEVHYIDPTDYVLAPDGRPGAWTRRSTRPGADPADFLAGIQRAVPARVHLDELDVVLLRAVPSFEYDGRPWAQPIDWQFADLARRRGVLVLSDPRSVAQAGPDKYYTLKAPAACRPPTLITRNLDEIREFAEGRPDGIVVKPFDAGAGESVYWVRPGDPNLAQIHAAVARRGYVIAQPFLPEIRRGSVRLFMLEGQPLRVDGQVAALRHLPGDLDIRTNYAIAARIGPADLSPSLVAEITDAVGPMLADDDLFLVGIDLIGDRVLEINVNSAGGLPGAERMCGVDFAGAVIEAAVRRRHDQTGTSPVDDVDRPAMAVLS